MIRQFSKNVSSFMMSSSDEMSTVDREKNSLEKCIKFRDTVSPSVEMTIVDREKKFSKNVYQVSWCRQVSRCEMLIEKKQFLKNVSSFVMSPSGKNILMFYKIIIAKLTVMFWGSFVRRNWISWLMVQNLSHTTLLTQCLNSTQMPGNEWKKSCLSTVIYFAEKLIWQLSKKVNNLYTASKITWTIKAMLPSTSRNIYAWGTLTNIYNVCMLQTSHPPDLATVYRNNLRLSKIVV